MADEAARVWVVDDDRAVRFVLAQALREAGYRVQAFEGAGVALDAIETEGVPEELAERIFLPLVSGHAAGSGLGLALAQQVAREHRGSLAYRSRPGHTVFTLLLPSWTAAEEGTDGE